MSKIISKQDYAKVAESFEKAMGKVEEQNIQMELLGLCFHTCVRNMIGHYLSKFIDTRSTYSIIRTNKFFNFNTNYFQIEHFCFQEHSARDTHSDI